ncbi:Copper(I)-binding protein [Geodermatophilus dictyosporus]|uniref:Copper(I)-binding protein n=1 Tax=Geodermatophilus dictyosporus TaxID=1523247 RepID=A0A1I5MJK8_9ACTN|nr:copper chaperone PCu(A)C [Geodermatophilus dictyosporus]SFP09784.1 Copper(I)-binding protein [Geodermatophilus dictyosporus]
MSRTPRRRRAWPAAPLLVVALSACTAEEPLSVPGPEVRGGAVGPDEAVTGDLSVLQVQLEYPLDGAYEVGEDARLFLGIANSGDASDVLVDVTGPFAEAVDGDGGEFAIPVPEDDNVYVGAEGAPSVTLTGLEESLRSSQSIPVTFVFERAGEVTLDAVVAAEGQDPTPTSDFPDPAEDPTP